MDLGDCTIAFRTTCRERRTFRSTSDCGRTALHGIAALAYDAPDLGLQRFPSESIDGIQQSQITRAADRLFDQV